MEDIKALITNTVISFVTESPANILVNDEPIWDKPLVGFAAGDDPYFAFFKQDIGEFYLSPLELLRGKYPGLDLDPASLTVVSWVLPQTRPTREENARMERHPGLRWARARLYGEEFNRMLAAHLVKVLNDTGLRSVAPLLYSLSTSQKSEKYGYASTWSERHTAFVAGLGTFGLCDGLITPVGKAMRCGSVIVEAKIAPTVRPYTTPTEYCLFYKDGSCYACATRCPVNAIDSDGHNKHLCREYLNTVLVSHNREQYKLDVSCCGLCQTGVPCESRVPG